MTLLELFNASAALEKLINCDSLPVAVSYRLSPLTPEIDKLGQAHRDLVTKYAPKELLTRAAGDGVGQQNVLYVDPKKTALFQKEFDALLAEEVSIPTPQLTLEDLESVKLTPREFSALGFLITETDSKLGAENGNRRDRDSGPVQS